MAGPQRIGGGQSLSERPIGGQASQCVARGEKFASRLAAQQAGYELMVAIDVATQQDSPLHAA